MTSPLPSSSLAALEREITFQVNRTGPLGCEGLVMLTKDEALSLLSLASSGAADGARRNQGIVDLVCAEGSRVEPSKINPGRVVVVDGRDGLDASEKSASDCFDALFEEQDGGTPPPRLYITLAARSLPPSAPSDA